MRAIAVLAMIWIVLTGCSTVKPDTSNYLAANGYLSPDEESQLNALDQEGPYEGDRIGIILVGDTGTGEPAQYQVARGIEAFCASRTCDMGLLLGDNFYPKGVKDQHDPQWRAKFEEPYKDLPFKFFPVIGNHDTYGNWRSEIEYKSDRWDMPGQWFAMPSAFASFYGLDTRWLEFGNPWRKQQRQWLAKALDENASTWTIVYGHYPVYSSGEHGDTRALKKHLAPLLAKHRVDFYISGHDHDRELIERDGTAFVISGAGAKVRPIKPGKDSVFARASLGFAHLLLEDAHAVLTFCDADGGVEFQKEYHKDEVSDHAREPSSPLSMALP